MRAAEFGQRDHRQMLCPIVDRKFLSDFVDVRFDDGGEAIESIYLIKFRRSGFAADQTLKDGVSRPKQRIEGREVSLWLDDNAAPAAFVKPHRNIVGDRMAGADVDVETGALALKGEREVV